MRDEVVPTVTVETQLKKEKKWIVNTLWTSKGRLIKEEEWKKCTKKWDQSKVEEGSRKSKSI